MENVFQKFRDKFIEETNTLLDQLENELLELEKKPDKIETLESVFRAMHTIKGISSMYGFNFISELTHHLENIFQILRDKKTPISRNISDVSLKSLDHIRNLLDDEMLKQPDNIKNHQFIIDEIRKLVDDLPLSKSGNENVIPKPIVEQESQEKSWYILLTTDESLYFRGISLMGIFKDLSLLGTFSIHPLPVLSEENSQTWGIILTSTANIDDIKDVFIFIEDQCKIIKLKEGNLISKDLPIIQENTHSNKSIISLENIEEIESNSTKPEKPLYIDNSSFSSVKQVVKRISVDSTKLDYLMFLVSELITVNSKLLLNTKVEKYDDIRNDIEHIDGLTKLFRNNALEIRLVPLNDLMLRFQRLIRDLSKQLGKKIELITEGTETELDKNTIDLITEPMMHILRNCIDHGIEMPEIRKRKGKSETGTIKLSVTHSGNHVNMKIADDGTGIDIEKVRLKAVEKGILKPADKPTDKEIYDIIFLPGFSTAQSLTEVSGRGVGMDVVKKKLTDLRGEISVESIWGKGSSFIIKIQQSVAIIDSLLFRIESSYFIIPLLEIEICIEYEGNDFENRRFSGTIPYNDELIHFIDLREKFGISGKYNMNMKIIIIKKNDFHYAILVDTIIGEHQAVLKPLGQSFQNQNIILSASQLGSGGLAFMIDTAALYYEISKNNQI